MGKMLAAGVPKLSKTPLNGEYPSQDLGNIGFLPFRAPAALP